MRFALSACFYRVIVSFERSKHKKEARERANEIEEREREISSHATIIDGDVNCASGVSLIDLREP